MKSQRGFLLLTCMILAAVSSGIILSAQRESFWLGALQQAYTERQSSQDSLEQCMREMQAHLHQQGQDLICEHAWCFTDWVLLARQHCQAGAYRMAGVGHTARNDFVHARIQIKHQQWLVVFKHQRKSQQGWDWVTTQKVL